MPARADQPGGARTRGLPPGLLFWSLPSVLLAAAGYELALLLWGGFANQQPGQSPDGEQAVAAVAGLAMLVEIVVAVALARRWARGRPVALFAPAAAAFVLSRFFTYDPYYFPTLRSYSDGGFVPQRWVFLLAGLSAGAAVITTRWPRLGGVASALIVLLLLLTFVVMGIGH